MNLGSCDNCGVVLDRTKIMFASEHEFYINGGIDFEVATWSSVNKKYVAKVKCPVCDSEVLDE